MEFIPHFSADLIVKLDQEHPDKCPDPADSEREIWLKAGERRLVNKLITLLERTEQETIEKALTNVSN